MDDGAPPQGSAEWLALNRAHWDERVPLHVASEFYDVAAFLDGSRPISLQRFEMAEVGDVTGKTLVHPQCHFGKDTLSWARLGATVTGIDFSAPAIGAAHDLAARAGLDAEFLVGNVYDAVALVDGRTFDIVYTGLGALAWLPDVVRWAQVMAALAAPGSTLYLAEFHPIHHVFGDDDLTVEHAYFSDEPWVWNEAGSYADPTASTTHNTTVEWNHGLGAVVTAIIDSGFAVELLHEHDHTLFPRWRFLERHGDAYRLPDGMPSLPLMYSLRARRHAGAD